jgi:DNA mismatch repair protein MutS
VTLATLEAASQESRQQTDLFASVPENLEEKTALPQLNKGFLAIEKELMEIDPDALTPREALAALYRLKALVQG